MWCRGASLYRSQPSPYQLSRTDPQTVRPGAQYVLIRSKVSIRGSLCSIVISSRMVMRSACMKDQCVGTHTIGQRVPPPKRVGATLARACGTMLSTQDALLPGCTASWVVEPPPCPTCRQRRTLTPQHGLRLQPDAGRPRWTQRAKAGRGALKVASKWQRYRGRPLQLPLPPETSLALARRGATGRRARGRQRHLRHTTQPLRPKLRHTMQGDFV